MEQKAEEELAHHLQYAVIQQEDTGLSLLGLVESWPWKGMQDCPSAIALQEGKLAAKQLDAVLGYNVTKLQLMPPDVSRIQVCIRSSSL